MNATEPTEASQDQARIVTNEWAEKLKVEARAQKLRDDDELEYGNFPCTD